MQELFVGLLFIGAIGYIVNRFRQDFKPSKTGCAKGCGNCGQIKLDDKLDNRPQTADHSF